MKKPGAIEIKSNDSRNSNRRPEAVLKIRQIKTYFGFLFPGILVSQLMTSPEASANPYVMSYSGRLTLSNGEVSRGPVDLEIKFFREAAGGNPVPVSPVVKKGVPLVDGVFQVDLTELSLSEYQMIFSSTQSVWVEVIDQTNRVAYPRQRLTGVPYAFKVPVDETTVQFDSLGRLGVATIPMGKVEGLEAALSQKTDSSRSIGIADVTGLTQALQNKAGLQAPLTGDVGGTLNASVVNKIRGVSVDNPQSGGYLNYDGTTLKWSPINIPAGGMLGANNLSDLTNLATARSNLGLGTLATAGSVGTVEITDGSITDADINGAAEIAQSKISGLSASLAAKQNSIVPGLVIDGGTFTTSLQNGVELKPYNTGAGQTGELRFDELTANGDNYVGLRAPDILGANVIWTLPPNDGASGQVLTTNGARGLMWSSPVGLGTVTSVGITTAGGGLAVSGSPVTTAGSLNLSLTDDLAALEGLSTSGVAERTGPNTWSTFPVTSAAKAFLDDTDAAAQRSTLGLGALATAANVSGGNEGTIVDGTITNADLSATAAIEQSKISGLTTALTAKEPTVAAGNTGQYYRGDKTWQTLNTTAVSEGDNQYFTADRARSALSSAGEPLIYDRTTGVLSIRGQGIFVLESKNAAYAVQTSDVGKFFIVTGNPLTTLTLPTAAGAGSGFNIRVKGNGGWALVARSGSDLIEGDPKDIALIKGSQVQLVSDGSTWHITDRQGDIWRGTPALCTGGCYGTGGATAKGVGLGYTSSSKLLTLMDGIWVQADGNNVLSVDGSDSWQPALNGNGRGFQVGVFMDKNKARLVGRACPPHVYLDDNNKTVSSRCLYYDRGTIATMGPSTGQSSPIFQLGAWNTSEGGNGTGASFYEGNIQICADKGMRLPLLFETTATAPTSNLPSDFSPTYAGSSGVPAPHEGYAWTASASTNTDTSMINKSYWTWAGSERIESRFFFTNAVRCVTP